MDPFALKSRDAPAFFSRREIRTAWALFALTAVTRVAAFARSLWDWDEALFALAVRDYDVALYHPQPPGFPLFIGLAKLLPGDEFRALQLLTLGASILVFPAMLFLARELRVTARVALAAAVLLAFLPNVWLFGGTALSDVPSMVVSITACALMLRGCRDGRSALAGVALLGAAIAVRPQNALIGLPAALLVLRFRPRAAIAGGVLAAAVIGVSYGAAVQQSGGWAAYSEVLAVHGRYLREADSFTAAARPSLLRLADDFFYRPFRAELFNAALAILGAAGLVGAVRRREWQMLIALATFVPFALVAWLSLDFHSASRFSIAWMPLVALLAARGMPSRGAVWITAAFAAGVSFRMWPGMSEVRNSDSPPVAALEAALLTDPGSATLWLDDRLAAHGGLLLQHRAHHLAGGGAPVVMQKRVAALLVQEGTSDAPGARNFIRPRAGLEGIVRDRFFEASIVPLARVSFREGWYGEEGPIPTPWRWMGRRARIVLPRRDGPARIEMRMHVPAAGAVDVLADGRLLERLMATAGADLAREWTLKRMPREIVLVTTSAVHARGDPRELALRLDWLVVR